MLPSSHAHRGAEIRRDLGRRHRPHPGCRGPDRPRARAGPGRGRRRLGHGRDHGRPPRQGLGHHARPRAARARHAPHGRRAHRDVPPRDRRQRPRLPGRLVHRLPGRDHHRYAARQGPHRRDPPHADQGVPRRRQRRDPGRVPGPVDRVRHHDARARGLGHDRGRDGGRPRGGRVRDLHRRRRRLHRRPPDPSRGPQDRPDLLRGDARARRRRREGPPAAVRGVRSTPRRPDPRSELPG